MNPYYDLVPSLPTHDNNWLFGQPLPDFAHLLPLFDTFAQPTDQELFAAERLRKYQREKGGELDVLLAHQIRMFLTVAYSWAIPSPEALDLIASLGPVLEVGAVAATAGRGRAGGGQRAEADCVFGRDLRRRGSVRRPAP